MLFAGPQFSENNSRSRSIVQYSTFHFYVPTVQEVFCVFGIKTQLTSLPGVQKVNTCLEERYIEVTAQARMDMRIIINEIEKLGHKLEDAPQPLKEKINSQQIKWDDYQLLIDIFGSMEAATDVYIARKSVKNKADEEGTYSTIKRTRNEF